MFYQQLKQQLKHRELEGLAKHIHTNERELKRKIENESLTIDEALHLIRAMQSLSMIDWVMGELHPPWREQHGNPTLN